MKAGELESAMYLFKDFLEEQKKFALQGITLETVFHRMGEIGRKQDTLRGVIDTVVADQIGINMRLDRYAHRIKKLERGANRHHGEDHTPDEEDSGIIRVEEARRAHELTTLKARMEAVQEELRLEREMKTSNVTFWERQRWLWVAAVMVAIATSLMSGCTGLIVWKISQTQQTQVQGQAK